MNSDIKNQDKYLTWIKKPIFLAIVLNIMPGIPGPFGAWIEAIYLLSLFLLLSWLYIHKYNEPIPKNIRFKTAIYSAIIICSEFLFFIITATKSNNITNLSIITPSILYMLAVSGLDIVFVYFGLKLACNFITFMMNIKNKNPLSIKNLMPIILTFLLVVILTIAVELFEIFQKFTGINISFIGFIISIIAPFILVSWLYLYKYNEPIPKNIRFKTAICFIFLAFFRSYAK